MISKLQYYSRLAENQTEYLTGGRDHWTTFLDTASRLYKYPFSEQLMIFAQRPDATACAPLEIWNSPMNRFVKRGSKGIALIDSTSDKPRLKYVFDISDTQDGRENPKRPFLWALNPEHEAAVTESLSQCYGNAEGNLYNILYSVAEQLADEYYNENAAEILNGIEGSYLDEYDIFSKAETFREALIVSTAYCLMSRCGLDAGSYFRDEDFQPVFNFNTPGSVYALGTAVSALSEQVLREIEIAVKKYERQKTAERSISLERSDLFTEWGLSDTRFDIDRANRSVRTDRQVWQDAQALSGNPPDDIIQHTASAGATVSASERDRSVGNQTAGADNEGTVEKEPAAGQSGGSTGLDFTYEQLEIASGGNDIGRVDLQLNQPGRQDFGLAINNEETLTQISLFPTEQVQHATIKEAEARKASASDMMPRDNFEAFLDNGNPKAAEPDLSLDGIHYTPRKHIAYRVGDSVDAFPLTLVIDRIDGGNIHYHFSDVPDAEPDMMPLKNFEESLDFDRFTVIKQESADITPEKEPSWREDLVLTGQEAMMEDISVDFVSNTTCPQPVFFTDWQSARHDIDKNLYDEGDVIGYNKDGVKYTAGKVGGVTYIIDTPMIASPDNFPDDSGIPNAIAVQIKAYRDGRLSDEQVRQNYLNILARFFSHKEISEDKPILSPEPDYTPDSAEAAESADSAEATTPAHAPQDRVNFVITDDQLGEGGRKTKYNGNITAIRTLKQIEAENRLATPEEQDILSRYVGWGGIPQAFDSDNNGWSREYSELKNLLTDNEYEMARASTLNAHYTSPTIIKAIYDTVERMGFTAGNILEPACGVGNFFGLLPGSMQNAKLYGIELDSITGRIAKQLYQKADITVSGFEKTDMPDSFFDLAIGNVPFGGYGVSDKKYDKHSFLIHDYFFAKTLDQVRAGGIIAFVTSKGTLDKQNPEVRKYIAQRAELLGAVRLPNNTFRKNADTEVTSDIIFLQKRDRLIDIQPEWVHVGLNGDNIPVNSYYIENPHMVLGTMAFDESMYGNKTETTCNPFPGTDLAEQLKTALSHIRGQITEPELDNISEISSASVPAGPDVKNFSFTLMDDKVYFRENSLMYPVEQPGTTLERIKGMIALRDCVHELIDLQLNDYDDTIIREKQNELNRLYDGYTEKYGLMNDRGNSMAFSDDPAYYLLCSLEILDEDGRLERKADMFSKRTIKSKTVVTSVDTASEALAVSIGEKACVDLDFMARLMRNGDKVSDIIRDLQGVIFREPAAGPFEPGGNYNEGWQTADEYLSGNVREKLAVARKAAEAYPEFEINVKALETAQPKDLDASEISVRLGSTWIDKSYIRQFMHELLQTPYYLQDVIKVNYSAHTGEWGIENARHIPYNHVLANVTYGTNRMNAFEIIRDTLNLKDVRIYDTVRESDGTERRVLNKKETTIAQQKQEAIKQKFKDWIFEAPDRRHALVKLYNERFNSIRPREYDGSHINFSGISPEITLRPHQLNAIAHVLYGGNTLLAHEVGAGKTFEMVAAAMESKRLGLCRKSLFAVPGHLTEQWAAEFLRLYPSANLLVATAKDFETKNRRKFCAKIATGEYDAVIIGHSQLEKIAISKERQEKLLREQIWDISEGIAELKRNRGEHFSIKQLEKAKKSLETRLQKLNDSSRKDSAVTFEQLGVDRLYVDEAHSFKNLFLYTKMRNVTGLSQSEAQKSSDLFAKCRYMDELTGNKGVVFATGTPVSNSITELYTLQRYLQYDTLQRNGLAHFDAWSSTFGETAVSVELAPEGNSYRARTRFSKFHNLPELMNIFKEVADIKTADTLDLPRPKANFKTVVVKPTELQQEMVEALSERAKLIQAGTVDPSIDNMLKVTGDGRKIGLDQRLMNPLLPDDPCSKVNACTENIFNIWQDTKQDKLTQLLFCDYSTPNADGRFNLYDDIKGKLIELGIPDDEIAFVHSATTEARKKELFAKVRQGKVRVLFGSTFKMGSGTNVQDRLIAIHDLDCPWRPADLEQRAGRIIRQGNINPEVDIIRYCTENTFDAYLWQTIEKKQQFISQIMTSKSPVRLCDDVDEAVLSYAEIKALCAGNPLIKEKMDFDIEVSRLRLLKADHQSQHYRLEDNLLKYFPENIERTKGYIEGFSSDLAKLEANTMKDGFSPMTIGDVVYTEKDKAGAALLEACAQAGAEPYPIGSYRGFDMSIHFEKHNGKFQLTLQGSMSYSVELGLDELGNISRINNVFADLPKRLKSVETQLENLYQQVETAKEELKNPFPLEAVLVEKNERLNFINTQLNIDSSLDNSLAEQPVTDRSAAGTAWGNLESAAMQSGLNVHREKPSILEAIKLNIPSTRSEDNKNKCKENCI